MQSRADFLKTIGETFARYAPFRVARIGCLTGIVLVAGAIAGAVAGLVPADPIFPKFFRILALTVIGSLLVVFGIFAALETAAERRVRREIREFVAAGGGDLATLLEMARTRKDRFPGSERVIEVLEAAARGGEPGSPSS